MRAGWSRGERTRTSGLLLPKPDRADITALPLCPHCVTLLQESGLYPALHSAADEPPTHHPHTRAVRQAQGAECHVTVQGEGQTRCEDSAAELRPAVRDKVEAGGEDASAAGWDPAEVEGR